MFTYAQHPVSILQQQQQEAIAQQQPEQETRQRIPLGIASGSNFYKQPKEEYPTYLGIVQQMIESFAITK